MVIKTAAIILMNAVIISPVTLPPSSTLYLHEMDNQDTFFRVRGKVQTKDRIKPTTPNTMEQVPCFVKVFIMTVKVKI